jgi:3-oxoacyl-[acyl-carrier protein] reductase
MTEKSRPLAGKVALVTGASRGIGKAVALALAEGGAAVAINYRQGEAEANSVAEEIERSGGRCIVVQADVSRNDDVSRITKRIKDELGTVQILINNAGISRPQALKDISEKDWDDLIDTNLKSAFLVTKAFLPEMMEQKWGRIINMSSVAAQLGGVIGPHYAASKAGLIGLTHSYAHLLAKTGITVNAITPALIETEMVTNNPNARADLIPVGRFGTVGEVASVVVMLVGNGYMTGQTIGVNGGWYMS